MVGCISPPKEKFFRAEEVNELEMTSNVALFGSYISFLQGGPWLLLLTGRIWQPCPIFLPSFLPPISLFLPGTVMEDFYCRSDMAFLSHGGRKDGEKKLLRKKRGGKSILTKRKQCPGKAPKAFFLKLR